TPGVPGARPLPAPSSAIARPPLRVCSGCVGTLALAASLPPCITAVARGGVPCGPHSTYQGQGQGLPGPAHDVSVPARGGAPARGGDVVPGRWSTWGLPRVRSAAAPRRGPLSGLHTLPAHAPGNAAR